jgi:hypothetical protein
MEKIKLFWKILNESLEGFWVILDRGMVVRRASYVVMLYMTTYFINWSLHFAETSTRTGTDIAAIIAAIGVPLSALQGVVMKIYSDSRTPTNTINT